MRTTWRRVAQGLAFIVVLALLLGVTILKFERKWVFHSGTPVTLVVDHTGTQLGDNADVKIRGIIVGRVASQRSNGTSATLSLLMSPSKLAFVPRNVRARLLPKTLFGEKFVDLVVPPDGPSRERLRKGDVIREDRSAEAVEVEQVLADLFPLLRALKPEKLNEALSAMAQGLQGRGDELGASLAKVDEYLSHIDPKLPTIQSDLSGLADLAESLDRSAPDLLRIARNSVTTGTTLVQKQDAYAQFLRGTAGFADTMANVLRTDGDGLIYLSYATRRTLETVYPKRGILPSAVFGLNELLTRLNAALNHGPALKVRLEPVNSRGLYLTPCNYPDPGYNGGCPIGQGETAPPPVPAGQPGSPQEQQAVRELLAPGLGLLPEQVPDLTMLLLTPLLRGSVVDQ